MSPRPNASYIDAIRRPWSVCGLVLAMRDPIRASACLLEAGEGAMGAREGTSVCRAIDGGQARRLGARRLTRSALGRHVAHCRINARARLLDGLDVKARPRDPIISHAKHDHTRHVEAPAVGLGALPAPLRPRRVANGVDADKLGVEVGHPREDARPVRANLLAPA